MTTLSVNVDRGSNKLPKCDFIQKLFNKHEPKVVHIQEPNVFTERMDIPKFLPGLYEIHYIEETKHRIISFALRSYGLKRITPTIDFGMPVIYLEGREITNIGLYSEGKKYDIDGSFVEVSDKERTNKIISVLNYAATNGKRMIIISGDMNLDLKDSEDANVKRYKNAIRQLGFRIEIDGITRPKSRGERRTGGTCIDHILTRGIEGQGFIEPWVRSDHHPIIFKTEDMRKMTQRPLIMREEVILNKRTKDFARDTYPFMNPDYDWTNIKKTIAIWERWMTNIRRMSTRTQMRKEGQKPFWSPKILNLKRKFLENPADEQIRKKYRAALDKLHKDEDTKQLARKGHPHREKIRTQLINLRIDGVEITDRNQIAQIEADVFEQKVLKIKRQAKPNFGELLKRFSEYNEKVRKIPKWKIPLPTYDDIHDLIKKLPKKKSCGEDGLSYNLLKHVIERASSSLCRIIQQCMIQGYIELRWLSILITCVFKKGDPEVPTNYRPIGLGHLILRIIEKWYSICLTRIAIKHELIPENMHGFISGRSCETCLISMTNYIETAKKEGFVTCVLLLDATCAFDGIPRPLIIGVLKALQMHEISEKFIKAYLENDWYMTVKVDEGRSKKFKSPDGVIQGGGCSATFYVLTSTIIEWALRKLGIMYFYADDSALVLKLPKDQSHRMGDLVRLAIQEICLIYELAGLVINEIKSEILPMYNLDLDGDFFVKGHKCWPVKVIKFLGTWVMQNLSQERHKNEIIKKLHYAKFKLLKDGYNRSVRDRIILYMANIRSHVDYCRNYWLERSTKKQRLEVEKVMMDVLLRLMKVKNRTKDGKCVSRGALRRKYGLKSMQLSYEETKMMRALEYGNEFEFRYGILERRNAEMVLEMKQDDSKGNKYRKLWNEHPLHLLYRTNQPRKAMKRWLKKVTGAIMLIERTIGRNLVRPPDGDKPIPLKWQFEQADAMYEQMLFKNDIIIKSMTFLKFGNYRKSEF